MLSNPLFLADLVTLTEEILNGQLHSLCSALLHYVGFQIQCLLAKNEL